jgi:acyl-coenzyme A thioesterase PaaI-like protein
MGAPALLARALDPEVGGDGAVPDGVFQDGVTRRQFRIRSTLAPNEPSTSNAPNAQHPAFRVRPDDDLPPDVVATRRAATAMRRIMAGTLNGDATVIELVHVADMLEELAEKIEAHRRSSRYEKQPLVVGGDNSLVLETHPILGPSNPLAPPLVISRDDDRAVATVTYGHQYEGPPDRVHGGMIAAGFDMVLGAAAALSGTGFYTGTLTVRYRAATPLYVPLRYEASIDRVVGRRIHASGRLVAGDELTADAEGVFVSVNREVFDT